MASAAKQDDNVVELRKNVPADDAVIVLNIGKYKRGLDDLNSEQGRFRNTVKHVESKGINTKALKRAISIQKSGKTEEIISELSALFEYLLILGLPIDKKQLDMFRVDGNSRDGAAKAQELGRYTGLMGQGTEQNPYALDSDLGQAWMQGFHGGVSERELVMSMEPTGDELIKGGADDDVFDEDED